MKLTEILVESYQKINHSITGLDRDIAEYALNEVPLRWSEDDTNEARSIYGNIPVGIVYRGVRINSEAALQQLKALQGGGMLAMELGSASPHWDTAVSFANYVKSYDELTMMRMLSSAVKNGSAGAYGVAVITLAPTPDQVIVKTYRTGNEHQYNPNWKAPEESAESEVILSGNIKVTDVQIIPPINKENWKEVLFNTIDSIEVLASWQLLDQWFPQHNISSEEQSAFAMKLWPKLIRSNDDLVRSLSVRRLSPIPYIKSQPKLVRWLVAHISKDESAGFRPYSVQYNNKSVDIEGNEFIYKCWLKGRSTVDNTPTKNSDIVFTKLANIINQVAAVPINKEYVTNINRILARDDTDLEATLHALIRYKKQFGPQFKTLARH